MKSDQMRVFARPVPTTLPNDCPSCLAKAHEPCRMATGQARHEPHFERQIAADEIDRKLHENSAAPAPKLTDESS